MNFFETRKDNFFSLSAIVHDEGLCLANRLNRLPCVVVGGVTLPTHTEHHIRSTTHVARMVDDLVDEELPRITGCNLDRIKPEEESYLNSERFEACMCVDDLVCK